MTAKDALLELARDPDGAQAAHFDDLVRRERVNLPEPFPDELGAAIERGFGDIHPGRLIGQHVVERELGQA